MANHTGKVVEPLVYIADIIRALESQEIFYENNQLSYENYVDNSAHIVYNDLAIIERLPDIEVTPTLPTRQQGVIEADTSYTDGLIPPSFLYTSINDVGIKHTNSFHGIWLIRQSH